MEPIEWLALSCISAHRLGGGHITIGILQSEECKGQHRDLLVFKLNSSPSDGIHNSVSSSLPFLLLFSLPFLALQRQREIQSHTCHSSASLTIQTLLDNLCYWAPKMHPQFLLHCSPSNNAELCLTFAPVLKVESRKPWALWCAVCRWGVLFFLEGGCCVIHIDKP